MARPIKPRHKPYDFVIGGGLDRQFYKRHRALREKYDLSDKGLFECMLWFLLSMSSVEPHTQEVFLAMVETYKVTPPSEMTIPEVV